MALKQKATVITRIKVFDRGGNLKEKRVLGNDLILDNFIKYLQVTTGINPTLVNTGGNNKTFDVTKGGPTAPVDEADISDQRKIAVGTGTTGPSRSDYSLGSKAAETTEVDRNVLSDRVSWSSSITLASAADITEAGFLAHIWLNDNCDSPNYSWFLFFREVFSAISVAAGETISVTFELVL